MATTTSNLLDVVNTVLLENQERRVNSFTSNASQVAESQVRQAFTELQEMHNWEWMKEFASPDSWSTDVATFNNLRNIDTVRYNTTVGSGSVSYIVPWVTLTDYLQETLTAFTTSVNSAYVPLRWTKVNDTQFRVNPYPNDATTQARVRCEIYRYQVPPSTTTGVFGMSERFVPLLVKLATSKTAWKFGHADLAQSSRTEFEIQLRLYQQRETGFAQVGNMFQAHKRYEVGM
jgi:hypothetical protein